MSSQDDFRDALARMDVDRAATIMQRVSPHLPAGTYEQTEISLHMARTGANFLPLKARAYSHAWLLERGHRSLLPDELLAKAQRIYPTIAAAVGIAVKARHDDDMPAALEIRSAMEAAVLEAVEDGHLDNAAHIKMRIDEARRTARRRLFG